jgi:hypothetical protein
MKTWQKPQLIVLVRSKPEEAILQACKGVGSGPYDYDQGCTAVPVCGYCDQTTQS